MKNTMRWLVPAIALIIVIAAAALLYPRLAVRYAPQGKPEAAADETVQYPGDYEPETTEEAEEAAPDFTVYDADGNAVHLSDFAGQPVVVNFWASWCPPCRSELPDFDALCAEYGDRVAFLMVNLTDGDRETMDIVQSFLAEEGYTFPVYYDTDFSAAEAYQIYSIPVTIFIRPDGTLADQQIGAMSGDLLKAHLDALLNGE